MLFNSSCVLQQDSMCVDEPLLSTVSNFKGLGGNEIPDFHLNSMTDKSARFGDGCITHELWSPSELGSSSQTSNDKMFIAPKSIIYCAHTIFLFDISLLKACF